MVVHGRHGVEFAVSVTRRALVREGDVPGSFVGSQPRIAAAEWSA